MNYRDNASPSEAQVWFEKALFRAHEENSAYIKSVEDQILARINSEIFSKISYDEEVKFPFLIAASSGRPFQRENIATDKAIENLNQIGWSIKRYEKGDQKFLRVDIKLIEP